MAAALVCRSLDCGYSRGKVLTGIDFAAEKGEVIALLGPNGCGKSTLLKTVIGEIPVLGGSVTINERAAADMSGRERAREVAFVPSEERAQFPFLVREIVAMGRIPHSEGLFDSKEDVRITEEAMRSAGCDAVADRPITQVSAGEAQRALIARALAQQAPLLLLDEPTSHLDPGRQVGFVNLIRQLARNGLTMVIALHDLNLTAHLADKAILLDDGKIAASGKSNDVLASDALDRAYGTKFERTKGSDGLIRLSPLFNALTIS